MKKQELEKKLTGIREQIAFLRKREDTLVRQIDILVQAEAIEKDSSDDDLEAIAQLVAEGKTIRQMNHIKGYRTLRKIAILREKFPNHNIVIAYPDVDAKEVDAVYSNYLAGKMVKKNA